MTERTGLMVGVTIAAITALVLALVAVAIWLSAAFLGSLY